jgi:hypothetical protein
MEIARPQIGRLAAMYMLRPIAVYLGSMLSILVLCASSAVVKAEENPEIVRGPGAEKAQPPPKPAIIRCGNLINGYVKTYQCCCTYWNGYNNRYCIVSKPRNSDGTLQPKSGSWGVALSDRIGGLGRYENRPERVDRSPWG